MSIENTITDTQKIFDFLLEIGLPVHKRKLSDPTFLPGIAIECGELVVDQERLAHPGDLLHEAGHLAVKAPSVRHLLSGDLEASGGEEMAAIAWSYAAALHLGLDPSTVFHEEGYKGSSEILIKNFESGGVMGVPLLEWYGMTRFQRKDLEGPDFPKMHQWVRTMEVDEG